MYLSVHSMTIRFCLYFMRSLREDRQATMTSHMFSLKETVSLREILIIQDHMSTYQL